jgi:hypothetical protein
MGGVIGAAIGLLGATFGFLVMRNPMRLALLAPGQEGYYQRLVLDTSYRNGLRMLGALICVFGAVILTAALGGVLKLNFLKSASDRLPILLGLIFVAAFVSGLVQTVKQTIKGELFDWFRAWRAGTELGPLDVSPAVTPKMEKEARIFTVALIGLIFITVAASGLR